MKEVVIIWIISIVFFAGAIIIFTAEYLSYRKIYDRGFQAGIKYHQDSLPSALYILRPVNGIKPWGCDGKEGIDIRADEISGGGYFISMKRFK